MFGPIAYEAVHQREFVYGIDKKSPKQMLGKRNEQTTTNV